MRIPKKSSLTLAGVVFLVVATALALRRDSRAIQIEACKVVLARALDESAEVWRARARGELVPQREPALVAAACSPRYSEPACRAAWEQRDAGDPASRAARLARECRDAYCPKLSPKPRLCSTEPNRPSELHTLWRELDDAILVHELGARAEPLAEIRRRGGKAVEEAMSAYFEAGSPAWQGTHGFEIRALPSDASVPRPE